jgi:hypothetical protein
MKPSKPLEDRIHRIQPLARPLNYSWSTPDGAIYHGHTIILARDKRRLKRAIYQAWHTRLALPIT